MILFVLIVLISSIFPAFSSYALKDNSNVVDVADVVDGQNNNQDNSQNVELRHIEREVGGNIDISDGSIGDKSIGDVGVINDQDVKNAIARGAEVYLNTCIKCHEISDVKYSDLIAIGADVELKGKIVSEQLMEQNVNLTSVIRSRGYRYVLNILKGYKKDEKGDWYMKDDMYYNYFFKDNYIKMPPLLTDENMIDDVVVFLEWSADRHADMRFKMGVKVVVFLFILLVFIGLFLVFDGMNSAQKSVDRE